MQIVTVNVHRPIVREAVQYVSGSMGVKLNNDQMNGEVMLMFTDASEAVAFAQNVIENAYAPRIVEETTVTA
jgi:hypothetical protein